MPRISSKSAGPIEDGLQGQNTSGSIQYRVHSLNGSLPFMNDHLMSTVDPIDAKFYLYGGEEPGMSRADLHVVDVATMTVSDLSNQLIVSREPTQSLCSPINSTSVKKGLPSYALPSFDVFRLHGKPFLFLFSGHLFPEDGSEGEATSDVVIVDLENNTWWREPVQGPVVRPRVDAPLAFVGNKVFFFGGRDKVSEDAQRLYSYSILEFSNTKNVWKWVKADIPYGDDIGPNVVFESAISVSGGQEIFLTPGNPNIGANVTFTTDNCYLFHTTNFTFQQIKLGPADAKFPQSVRWHCTYPLNQKATAANAAPIKDFNNCKPGNTACNSVVVCGWRPVSANQKAVPELWRICVPDKRIECLEISKKLTEINARFYPFVAVHSNQLILLGVRDKDVGKKKGKKDNRVLPMDVCLEIFSE